MTVIGKALGVHLDRMDDFMAWSKIMVAGIGKRGFGKAELGDLVRTRAKLAEYLLGVIAERDAEPQDDLISHLVRAEIDGERLTHAEVMNMVVQFLLAGNDTTSKLIATAMLRLAEDPAQADRLRADPELIPPFVEEVLRTGPPINGTYRIADQEYVLGGVTIPAGSARVAGLRRRQPRPRAVRAARRVPVPAAVEGAAPHLRLRRPLLPRRLARPGRGAHRHHGAPHPPRTTSAWR